MRAMILAAGFGTRLAALGLDLPKPLFPVLNVPLIGWCVSFLKGHGITEIVINLHHRGAHIREALGDGAEWGVHIAYSIEEGEILGTGGGIKHALPLLGDGPFVVMNGKIVTDLDLHAAIAQHRAVGADATLVVRPDPYAKQWGAVSVDSDHRVRALLGEPAPLPPGMTDTMFTGVHVLEPDFVRRTIPEGPACIVQQGYRPTLRAGSGHLAAYVHEGYFWDHSTPARWLGGNLNLLTGRTPDGARAAARFPPPGPDAYLARRTDGAGHTSQASHASHADGASNADDTSNAAPIDPGDRISPGAHVESDARIQPGAHVESDARIQPGAHVAPDARIQPGAHVAPDARIQPGAHVAPDAEIGPATLIGRDAVVGAGARVGPATLIGRDAVVGAGARVGPAALLGPGARVAPSVEIHHALVYAGAHVEANASGAIVTPDGRAHPIDLGDAGPRTGPALGRSQGGS